MTIYLGLGSNLGDRQANLSDAIQYLVGQGFVLHEVSPLVESPALLPDNAKSEWDRAYLNVVIAGEAEWNPQQGLDIAKQIEKRMGRQASERWSPRPIDIDLLIWDDVIVQEPNLQIPHPQISQRAFVITPLLHLKPQLQIPGLGGKTVISLSEKVRPIPLWMGILNITPDSFSDGNAWADENALSAHLDLLISQGVQILDIGAESTRPHATEIDMDHEWQRLKPVIEMINDKRAHLKIAPRLSVDSRNPRTIEKALDAGADLINDVTGLQNADMIQIAKESQCDVVAMHSLSVPVDPTQLLPIKPHPMKQLNDWLSRKIDYWLDCGLDLNRIIFDPGIGFGKRPMHSMELMGQCAEFRQTGLRLLIGHSRKSFMNSFTDAIFQDRDAETLGVSMALCEKGVDIIRVHDAVSHMRAYRGWSQISERLPLQIT